MAEHGKPSFLKSAWEGMKGYVKGAIAGIAIGAVGGALLGAAFGAIAGGLPGMIAGATIGAQAGASALGAIGAIAGTMTGVVKSRESAQPSADDVVNVAKIAFAQGVAVGHQVGHEHAAAGIQHEEGTTFRDRIAKERAQIALTQNQIVH